MSEESRQHGDNAPPGQEDKKYTGQQGAPGQSAGSKPDESRTASAGQENSKGSGVNCEYQTPPGQVCMPIAKYEEIKKYASDCINTAKEIQLDFDNYKRRNAESRKDGIDEGIIKTCEAMLPALDSFKKARKLIIDRSTINGILMIETSMLNALEKLGIKRIPTVGHPFDPNIHNAIMAVADFKVQSNTVIEEMQAGYTLNGKLIRVAQVIVAK